MTQSSLTIGSQSWVGMGRTMLRGSVKIFISWAVSNAMNLWEMSSIPSLHSVTWLGPYARSHSVGLGLCWWGTTWTISLSDYSGHKALTIFIFRKCNHGTRSQKLMTQLFVPLPNLRHMLWWYLLALKYNYLPKMIHETWSKRCFWFAKCMISLEIKLTNYLVVPYSFQLLARFKIQKNSTSFQKRNYTRYANSSLPEQTLLHLNWCTRWTGSSEMNQT